MKDRVRRPREQDRSSFTLSRYLPGTSLLWKLFLLVVLLGFCLLAADFYHFATSDAFQFTVDLRGLERVPEKKVLATVEPLLISSGERRSLFEVSPFEVRQRLQESIPRFEAVSVTKKYPDTLLIQVDERRPVALVARVEKGRRERFYLPVDRTGTLFPAETSERNRLKETLPVVLGMEESRVDGKDFSQSWNSVHGLIAALQQHFSLEYVETIEIRTGGYLEMKLNHPRSLDVRLGKGRMSGKVHRLAKLIHSSEFQSVREYVDLSQEGKVIVQ